MRDIVCPYCNKMLAKIEYCGKADKLYLWCKKCKKEIYIRAEEPTIK